MLEVATSQINSNVFQNQHHGIKIAVSEEKKSKVHLLYYCAMSWIFKTLAHSPTRRNTQCDKAKIDLLLLRTEFSHDNEVSMCTVGRAMLVSL